MCGCKKSKDVPVDTSLKANRDAKREAKAQISDQKIANGEKLLSTDVCIYCRSNLIYHCRKGCILTRNKYNPSLLA